MTPTVRHEAQQPANGRDNEEDNAYPQQPAQGLRESAHKKKNNCHYTSNDQKRIHGQHIPFRGIFGESGIPDYAFRFTSMWLCRYQEAFPQPRSAFTVTSQRLHRWMKFAGREQ
jgi:hypothetical protein